MWTSEDKEIIICIEITEADPYHSWKWKNRILRKQNDLVKL